jgi:antitoxin (DNA-binding transcriptional repressor) of toxin-antitoxin stability system
MLRRVQTGEGVVVTLADQPVACIVPAEVALKLAATFSTTPDFWLNAQKAVDLFAARSKLRRLPKPLVPGRPAA